MQDFGCIISKFTVKIYCYTDITLITLNIPLHSQNLAGLLKIFNVATYGTNISLCEWILAIGRYLDFWLNAV